MLPAEKPYYPSRKHEATAMSSKDHKDSCMKTPTAIPINVPLKPYSPFFISSRP